MKKIALLLLSFIVLLFVGVAIVLLPAHIQVRSIQPAIPDFSAIEAATVTENGPVAVTYINSASQLGPTGNLGHPGVLIRWASGRQFLIDTGMRPEAAVSFGKPIELILNADPAVPHGSIATQLGESVEFIEGIAFTHLHTDHTDGLPSLCAAQRQPATVFQTTQQYREQNHTTAPGLKHLEEATCERRELKNEGIMRVPGFPGLIAISLGGHTPGSTMYVVKVDERYWVFSGDITNDRASLVQDMPKHWLYSTLIVPEDTERTAFLRQWLRGLDARENVMVFPAHDVSAMADNLPVGVE